MTKSVKPFWNMPSLIDPAMDPEVIGILSGIQMRLNQLSTITKSTIGKTVGMASKQIGTQTSGAKNDLKLAVNNLETMTGVTKECSDASEPQVDQIRTDFKNQLSTCSKSAQLQLKSMNQVQKDISMQISGLSSESSMMVSQCRLENPLPTDTAAVNECCKLRSEALLEKINEMERNSLNTLSAVDAVIKQTVTTGNDCIGQVQDQAKEQLNATALQMEQCSASTPVL